MTSTALVPVAAAVVLTAREVERLPFCGNCGRRGERLKRLGGVGRPMCPDCYQRARRAAEAAFEDLRTVALGITDGVLYDFLVAKGLAPRSIGLYMRTIWSGDRWFTVNGWQLARATPVQVAEYAGTKPMSFSSQSLLRIAFGHYWELTEHPAAPVKAIRVPPKPAMVCRALEAGDARLLAKTARARGDRKGLAVLLGIYQGMRREEIASTRWDALDGDWITVIGKGAKTRTIPLHPVVRVALDALRHDRDGAHVFPGRVNGHISPASIWNWVREVADEAGVGAVRPHWLRHLALATANDETKDLRTGPASRRPRSIIDHRGVHAGHEDAPRRGRHVARLLMGHGPPGRRALRVGVRYREAVGSAGCTGLEKHAGRARALDGIDGTAPSHGRGASVEGALLASTVRGRRPAPNRQCHRDGRPSWR